MIVRAARATALLVLADRTETEGFELEWVGRINPRFEMSAHYNFLDIDPTLTGQPRHQTGIWARQLRPQVTYRTCSPPSNGRRQSRRTMGAVIVEPGPAERFARRTLTDRTAARSQEPYALNSSFYRDWDDRVWPQADNAEGRGGVESRHAPRPAVVQPPEQAQDSRACVRPADKGGLTTVRVAPGPRLPRFRLGRS